MFNYILKLLILTFGILSLVSALPANKKGAASVICEKGSGISTDGSCKLCPIGQYSNTKGSNPCLPCSKGSIAGSIGTIKCSDCKNSVSVICVNSINCIGALTSVPGGNVCSSCPDNYLTKLLFGSCSSCLQDGATRCDSDTGLASYCSKGNYLVPIGSYKDPYGNALGACVICFGRPNSPGGVSTTCS